MIALGFLVYFASLAYEDWRVYNDYRETRCTVFGSEIVSFEHRSRSGDRERSESFRPVFALRYMVDGVETFSTGYTTPSAINFNSRAGAGSVFDRFAIGTTHPCWYDPQDPKTVVLVRGPGRGLFLRAVADPGAADRTGRAHRRAAAQTAAASGAGITHPKIGE